MTARSSATLFTSRTRKFLHDGVVVCDLLHLQDAESRSVWYAAVHDEECNRFKGTSFVLKLEAVRFALRKSANPMDYFTQVLGPSCQSRVYKWIRAAKSMDPEVQEALKSAEFAKIPQTYLWDNCYLMGTGTKQKLKLSPDLAVHALNLVLHEPLPQLCLCVTSSTFVTCEAVFVLCNQSCLVVLKWPITFVLSSKPTILLTRRWLHGFHH